MFAFAAVAAVVAAVVYFACFKLKRSWRIMIALLTFAALFFGLLGWLVAVGDREPGGSVNVDLSTP